MSYSGDYSLAQVSDKIDVMSGDEYRAFMRELYPAGTTEGNTVRSLMGTSSTDWQDLIYQNAFSTDQNVRARNDQRMVALSCSMTTPTRMER